MWEKKTAVSSDHHYTADCTSTSCISRCNACVGTYSWEAGELTAELTFLPCEDWLGQLSWCVCAVASSTWRAEPTWKCWWSWVMGTTVVGFLWPVYIFLRLFSNTWYLSWETHMLESAEPSPLSHPAAWAQSGDPPSARAMEAVVISEDLPLPLTGPWCAGQ